MDKAPEKIITDVYRPSPEDRLSAQEIAKLTPKIVAERIRALKPYFIAHSEETELNRRPSDEVWRTLLKTGFMYLAVSKRFGGMQATMEEILDATYAIGEADASLGWLANFAVVTPRPLAGYSIEVQEKLYADNASPVITNVIAPICKAKRVKGGFRVTGRWAWCTTIQFADYVSMFANIEEEDGSHGGMRAFLAPRDQITIIDTWRAHGMIGTGTHHVAADDLFVPDAMVSLVNNGEPAWHDHITKYHPDYPLFLMSPAPAFAISLAIPVCAAARGAVEAARDHVMDYSKRGSPQPERERAQAQLRLGEASALAKAAELLLREASIEMYGGLPFFEAQKLDRFHEVRAWMSEAVDIARQVVQLLAQSMGTSIHYTDSRVGRFYRDVITGSSHTTVDFDIMMQAHGEKMLGIEPTVLGHIADRKTVRDEVKASTRGGYEVSKDFTSAHAVD